MFGSSNKDAKNADANSASKGGAPTRGLNTVNEGTSMTGDLTAESDIRIDGSINGNLNCKAKVIIGPKGSIDGEVICENAVIEGIFNGKLTVKDMLSIKETAKVTGNVITRKVAMMAGCDFEGTVTTKGEVDSRSSGQNGKVEALKAKEGAKA